MNEATNDEPNIDPAEAKARLDELEKNIQETRREAEDHGTLGVAADDDQQRFVDDGDIDDPMTSQDVEPSA